MTRILTTLTIVLGLFLFILPGIYWATRLSLAEPVAVAERISGRRAMSRSFELSTGNFTTLFALNFVVFFMIVISLVLLMVAMLNFPLLNHWIVQGLAAALLGIPSAYGTLCYYAAYRQFSEIEESAAQEDTPLDSAPLATSAPDAS